MSLSSFVVCLSTTTFVPLGLVNVTIQFRAPVTSKTQMASQAVQVIVKPSAIW